MIIHSTLTAPNKDGSTKDLTKMQVVWDLGGGAYSPVDSAAWWDGLLTYNWVTAALPLSSYLAGCVDRSVPAEIKDYDITAHLDGSPAGSPVGTATHALSAAIADSQANQVAAVISLSAASSGLPVEGVTGAVPTPEQAQDYGAPATHLGQLKVRARRQNRIYFGPIAGASVAHTADLNPVWDTSAGHFVSDAAIILTHMLGTQHGRTWVAWSRRDAAVYVITGGWIDSGIKTRRKRAYIPNARTEFGVP